MKLLAFSDLHRNRRRARLLASRAGAEADVFIAAGDFASVHIGLERTISALASIEVPTVVVPGNNETETSLRRACDTWPSAIVLHGGGVVLDGVPFFGLGGGVPPTPFPWSSDLSEEEAGARLAGCPPDAVLVVHSPPFGCRRASSTSANR
jgi:Icc-related predicted phosphoesterase